MKFQLQYDEGSPKSYKDSKVVEPPFAASITCTASVHIIMDVGTSWDSGLAESERSAVSLSQQSSAP
jgi:hypothetical protein